MERYGKAGSGGHTQPVCLVIRHKFSPLVAKCHRIILIVLGFGFESSLCQYQLRKYHRGNMWPSDRTL